jgi:NADH-quinone oxidoreductase subunit C
MSKKVLDLLQAQFDASILEAYTQFGDETAVIEPSRWREVARFLRDDPRIAMNMFTDLCAVDYVGLREARFEVVCHLRSLQHAHRIRIKARVGDEEGAGAEIESLVPVWKGANWFERETYDLMGIVFKGHPDLRRILMYPEFTGHPLRKDYPHDKIEPLIPFREGIVGKLPPFGPDEGAPFGRQAHDYRREDMRSYSQDVVGHPLPTREGVSQGTASPSGKPVVGES